MAHDSDLFSHVGTHELNRFSSSVAEVLLERVFVHDPFSNAVIAVSLLAAVTQVLMALAPKLDGTVLSLLVAFAEGSMLGTIFVHLLPEIELSLRNSLMILGSFLSFVVLDKLMRVFGALSHSHSGHSHAPSAQNASGIAPLLNLVADSLHNVTEGIALYLAFSETPAAGVLSLLIMSSHELPHQFGDFALLINSGMSSRAARKAHLATALGTLAGVSLAHSFGAVGLAVAELILPAAVGVFLYVAMVNVLPELLETDEKQSVAKNLLTSLVQIGGIAGGIAVIVYHSHH